jgi:F0F1-type ATP synthase epsilon subunit
MPVVKIEADSARLYTEIDEAEARKVANLQKELEHAEAAHAQLVQAVVEAQRALAAFEVEGARAAGHSPVAPEAH